MAFTNFDWKEGVFGNFMLLLFEVILKRDGK